MAPSLTPFDRRLADGGETVKWGLLAGAEARVETVLTAYPNRVTVCITIPLAVELLADGG